MMARWCSSMEVLMYWNGQELFSEVDLTSRQTDMFEARRHDDNSFFEDIIGDIKDALKGFKRYAAKVGSGVQP
jgi:hypothetical protein